MVRKSAPPAIANASANTSATTNAPIPTEVIVKQMATKAKKAEKSVAPKAEPVVIEAAAPAAETSIDAAAVPADSKSEVLLRFVEFQAKLQNLSSQLSAARIDFKSLEKLATKEIKKSSRGKKKLSGNRQPSGFIKPARISEDLANFLGKPLGVEMARTEVSKEINNYIRQNNLKDPANGRNINPDLKLSSLLKLEKDDKLTYFNLQKYMKHHFIKEVAATV